MTQAFVALLLERNDFQLADPTRGKFRTFLLSALTNFLANQRDYAGAQKRGGGQTFVSIDWSLAESRYGCEPANEETAEQVFQRQWALALLDQVLDLLQQSYIESGKAELFDSLSPYLTGNHRGDLKHYIEIADELGMSHDSVKSAVHRMRKRYRQLLRDTVAQTVASPKEVDGEIRDLFTALRRPSGGAGA